MKKIIVIMGFILLLLSSCAPDKDSGTGGETPRLIHKVNVSELLEENTYLKEQLSVSQTEIGKLEDELLGLRSAEANSREFREDVIRILNLFKSGELGFDLPVFVGFDSNNPVHSEQIRAMREFMREYRDNRINDEEITKEVTPVFEFLAVVNSENTVNSKEDEYLYKLYYYGSLVPSISYEGNNRLCRGPFDGLTDFHFMKVALDNGQWKVEILPAGW